MRNRQVLLLLIVLLAISAVSFGHRGAHTPADNFDVLQEVEDFYNDAFTRILWLFAILGGFALALFGIAAPILLQRWQRASFARDERRTKAKMTEYRDEMKQELEGLRADATEFQHRMYSSISFAYWNLATNANTTDSDGTDYLYLWSMAEDLGQLAGGIPNDRHEPILSYTAGVILEHRDAIVDKYDDLDCIGETLAELHSSKDLSDECAKIVKGLYQTWGVLGARSAGRKAKKDKSGE